MQKDKQPTKMIFRKYIDTGEIIALFPYEIENKQGHVGSYMHVGQHGAADLNYVLAKTLAVEKQEYASLLAELENIGYKVWPVKRVNRTLHYWAKRKVLFPFIK